MRIAALGATGRTGRLLVTELLRRGHTVTALVRDATTLDELLGRVEVNRRRQPHSGGPGPARGRG